MERKGTRAVPLSLYYVVVQIMLTCHYTLIVTLLSFKSGERERIRGNRDHATPQCGSKGTNMRES